MPKAYEKDYLIEKLQELAVVLGKTPTCTMMDSAKGFPSHHTYVIQFGSWNSALAESGLKKNHTKVVESKIKKLMVWEAAWLAGIIDCDGCVAAYPRRKGSYDYQLEVSNNCKEFLERIQKVVNGGRITEHKIKHLRPEHNLQYILDFRIREAEDLIPQILPFLVVKKTKAEEFLSLRKLLKIK